MKHNTRRDFLTTLALSAVGLLTFSWGSAKRALAQDKKACDLPPVEPGKGNAVALNYQNDKAQVKDAKLKVDRNGVKFQDQTCQKCMLWTKGSDCKKGNETFGKCSLFPNQSVRSTSWCGSWVKGA